MSKEVVVPADNIAGSFFEYRRNFDEPDRATSIETEGIFEEAVFSDVMADPRTQHVPSGDFEVPVMTPLENLSSWFNLDFYRRLRPGTDKRDIEIYTYLPYSQAKSGTAYEEAVVPRLNTLARAGGMLAVDHTDHNAAATDAHLQRLFEKAGVGAHDLLAEDEGTATHFHYASKANSPDADSSMPITEAFYQGYESLQKRSTANPQRSTTVHDALSQSDIDAVWEFYEPVFDTLTHDDPVFAGFSQTELQEILSAPEFIKIVHRTGATIVNMCVVAEVSNTPWMSAAYFKDRYLDEMAAQQVLCSVGIIANPNVSQRGSSMYTISMVGEVVRQAQIAPVITFACDKISNQNVPLISQRSMQRAGIDADYAHPVGRQIFRAFELRPR